MWEARPIKSFAVTLVVGVIFGNYFGRWVLLLFMRRPIPMAAQPGFRVGVATTFVPGAESLEMLEQTVRALVAMDYPHDTWVLDEGGDKRVQALCTRLGARYFSRKGRRRYHAEDGPLCSGTKYGNLNAWLQAHAFENYDIVSMFDPDHIPSRSFLTEVLGYFGDDRIGYVQAAQAYYNQSASLVARGAAEETYSYYSSIQMASYALGYPIIIGSHNTHRVEALREAGGLPAHDADDLLLTIVYRSLGWHGVYVPKILARGLVPTDVLAYVTQQRRWARSVLDIKLHVFPRFSGGLSPTTRALGYLHGLNYLYRSFVIFAALILLVFASFVGKSEVLIAIVSVETLVVMGVLAATDLFRQQFYLDPRERGLHWRIMLLHFAKWPYMLLALVDVLTRRRLPYSITPKGRVTRRPLTALRPHVLTSVVIAAAWAAGRAAGLPVDMTVYQFVGAALIAFGVLILASLRAPAEQFEARLVPEELRVTETSADRAPAGRRRTRRARLEPTLFE